MAKICPSCGAQLKCGCQKVNINGKICCNKCRNSCASESAKKSPVKVQYIGPGKQV